VRDCGKRIGPNGRAVHHWDVPRRPAGMLF